jgi:hypothetical protein
MTSIQIIAAGLFVADARMSESKDGVFVMLFVIAGISVFTFE